MRNLKRVVSGGPLNPPQLGSATLGPDDVELADRWLKDRASWHDATPVHEYHEQFRTWNGSRYAYSFLSGRVALSACIHALDLKPGDEVIVPGYTCVVVPNAFDFAGVKVAFCDIELDTYGPDVDSMSQRITKKTRAVLLQHLYGLVCRDYEAILALAKKHDLKVIEDCAHATGAEFKGRKVGNFGDVAFYSSERSKVFNTVMGGMAVTNDDACGERLAEYYEKAPVPDDDATARQLRNVRHLYDRFNHPLRWLITDLAVERGRKDLIISTTPEEMSGEKPANYGMKMPAPIAALGINQLGKLDGINELRRQTAKKWDRWCDRKGYRKPMVVPDSVPVFLRYPVMVEPEKKQNTRWAIKDPGVEAGVWFVSHLHPATHPISGCPNADMAVQRCVNFPTVC